MFLEVFSVLKTKSLLSSANTWSFQLIVDTIYLGIKAGKVAESFREDTFLKRSLSIVILRAVSILESKLISSFLLSLEEDKAIVLGEIFLEVERKSRDTSWEAPYNMTSLRFLFWMYLFSISRTDFREQFR